MRLAIVASHPIQYHAPLFRELARQIDLKVFFAHRVTPIDQAKAGFGVEFDWDIDLLSGYAHEFLPNVASTPCLESYAGCDTPNIDARLAEGRFDAVLLMGWHLKTFVQTVIAAKRLGIPLLARGDSQLQTARSTLKRASKAVVYPILLRVFDAALYVGERSRAYWMHYKYPAARLFLSPHCVDVEWFSTHSTPEAREALRTRLGLARDSRVVLFAGKLVPFKRPLDLVAAAKRLKNEGCEIEIVIAGSGPLQIDVAEAARAAGVSLHMLGFCNQSTMPAAYAAADVLVLPSDARETWGVVANEALACGRPVVVSNAVGAASDFATDGSVCRVYPMGNIGALAQTLRDILINPPAKEAIAAQSARYSVGMAADGIERAVRFAIGPRAVLPDH